jgi:hypothetical protein
LKFGEKQPLMRDGWYEVGTDLGVVRVPECGLRTVTVKSRRRGSNKCWWREGSGEKDWSWNARRNGRMQKAKNILGAVVRKTLGIAVRGG